MKKLGINIDQLETDLLKGSFVAVNVYGDRLTLCAQYGKFNLLGNNEWNFKQFDTFHEMCSRLELFSPEAYIVRVIECPFDENVA